MGLVDFGVRQAPSGARTAPIETSKRQGVGIYAHAEGPLEGEIL